MKMRHWLYVIVVMSLISLAGCPRKHTERDVQDVQPTVNSPIGGFPTEFEPSPPVLEFGPSDAECISAIITQCTLVKQQSQ